MKLRIVPASRGVLWVRQGFRVFFARPLSFLALFGIFLLGALVAGSVPWIGPSLFLACMPLYTLGFMLATQQVLAGHTPTPVVFSLPLQVDRTRSLATWQLGLAYALLMLGVSLVRAAIDGGRSATLEAAFIGGKATPESVAAMLADGRIQLGMLWFGLATAVVSVPFWHAPALVFWGGLSAPKALFFSTMACWRNKGAFALYALTWVASVLVLTLASALLFSLLGQPQWGPVAVVPLALLYPVLVYASLFFSFTDCFEASPS